MSVKKEDEGVDPTEESENTSDQFEFDTPTTGSVGSNGKVVNAVYKRLSSSFLHVPF